MGMSVEASEFVNIRTRTPRSRNSRSSFNSELPGTRYGDTMRSSDFTPSVALATRFSASGADGGTDASYVAGFEETAHAQGYDDQNELAVAGSYDPYNTQSGPAYDQAQPGYEPTTMGAPMLPDDLALLARPITYLKWEVRAVDGERHEVSLYYDNSAELVVNEPKQAVVEPRGRFALASCSSHVTEADLLGCLTTPDLLLRTSVGAASDHPMMAAVPEGRNLKFLFFDVEQRK